MIALDIQLAKLLPAVLVLVWMDTIGQDPEEETSKGEDICGALHATSSAVLGAVAAVACVRVALAVFAFRITWLRDELRCLRVVRRRVSAYLRVVM